MFNKLISEDAHKINQTENIGRLRDKLVGLNQNQTQGKYHDMREVVGMQSDKDLPNFLHKLNLRLNLYEPDLKFTTVNQK